MTLLLKGGFLVAEIKNVKLGDSQVNKIYSGTDLVFEANPVDTTAPITTIYPDPTLSYSSGQIFWLEVNEACETYYTLDGSTPTTASTKFTEAFALNATTTIKYFSVDLAGNVETVKTTTVTIVSAPVTTISPSATVQNNIPITVTLTTSEQGAAIKYKLGSSATVYDYTAPFQVNQTSAGVLSTNITVKYWAVGANATEAEKTITYDTSGAVPVAPVVTATAGAGQVALSWNATANTTSYTIYRSTVSGQLGTILAGTQYMTATNWTDSTVTNDTFYYYTVQAGNYGGVENSAQVSAIPMVTKAPMTIADLGAWYDSDTITATNGEVISTWNDISGNNRHLTAVDTDRPIYVENELNGLPVMNFNKKLMTVNFGTTISQPITIFVVVKTNIQEAASLFYFDGILNTARIASYRHSGGRLDYFGGAARTTTFFSENNVYYIYSYVFNGVNSSFRANKTPYESGDVGTNSLNGLMLNASYSGNIVTRLNANYAEFIMYEKALTTTEINTIEDYLNNKYKINNKWRYLKIQGYGSVEEPATTRMVEVEAWEGATNRMSAATILSNDAINTGGVIGTIKDGIKTSSGYPVWWTATPNANVVVDLGAQIALTKLNYYSYSVSGVQRANRFKILASNTNNGTDWVTLWDMSANTTAQPILPTGYELIL